MKNGWIWDILQGGTDRIFWSGGIWGEKEEPRMSNQVFVRGTWKIGIFIYQDEKMGWGQGGGKEMQDLHFGLC